MNKIKLKDYQREKLQAAYDKNNHPCSLRNFLAGCHCKDCIKIWHPEEGLIKLE